MDALSGKHLLILGLARQGTALARFALSVGAVVTVSDLRPAEQLAAALTSLDGLEVRLVLGEHPDWLLDEADVLAISGSVPADAPLVEAARARGLPVTNDSQLFAERNPALAIGITGSAGKTTTTSLTGHMGKLSGRKTWVGGNIGSPLISYLADIAPDDLVVQELSSFQLELWQSSPDIAAILNITPNHLDRHGTMAAYSAAKANILRYQGGNGVALLCADDPGSMACQPLVQGRLRLFSRQQPVNDGAFLRHGQLWLRDGYHEQQICGLSEVPLRGQHNILNVLAALTLASSGGVSRFALQEAVRTFSGMPHRLELVRCWHDIQFINDSIATAPERSIAAIDSFAESLVLLAGGRDKKMVWEAWARRVCERVKVVVLFGTLMETLAGHLAMTAAASDQPRPHIVCAGTLENAVYTAAHLAQAGDVVLLSPGGTSYDAFHDFEERGEKFREIVNKLEEKV